MDGHKLGVSLYENVRWNYRSKYLEQTVEYNLDDVTFPMLYYYDAVFRIDRTFVQNLAQQMNF